MRKQLSHILHQAQKRGALPGVVAYNRIDGPGSSLDLREFQQALWSMPPVPSDVYADPSMEWTRSLPRTVAITIDTGTRVTAQPLDPGYIGIQSIEYEANIVARPGEVHPSRENWLLKILDIFGLVGVSFALKNLHPGTKQAGLGGSATATTGVCILANELSGRPFSAPQLVSMASRLEQDLGVSITGTQEQSNVIYGGVTDYVWFPWGIPARPDTSFGESIRTELVPSADYHDLEQRFLIFHTGHARWSSNVNTVWRNALHTHEGYELHSKKPAIAYQFREGLRLRNWDQIFASIQDYRQVRTALCGDYLEGAKDILDNAERRGCTAFPLGAGGGGGVLIFSPDPEALQEFRRAMELVYQEITFRIRPAGHELFNLDNDLFKPHEMDNA